MKRQPQKQSRKTQPADESRAQKEARTPRRNGARPVKGPRKDDPPDKIPDVINQFVAVDQYMDTMFNDGARASKKDNHRPEVSLQGNGRFGGVDFQKFQVTYPEKMQSRKKSPNRPEGETPAQKEARAQRKNDELLFEALRKTESPEKIQEIKDKARALEEGLEVLRESAKRTTQEELALVQVATSVVARHKKKNSEPTKTSSKSAQNPPRSTKGSTKSSTKGSVKGASQRSKRSVKNSEVASKKSPAKVFKKDSTRELKGVLPKTEAERKIAKQIEEALDGEEMRNMGTEERRAIEVLLAQCGLSIDAPRGLEFRCHFKPILIPGVRTKTQEELNSFLERHPAHHLAIYSIERRQEGLACFHIGDLIEYLKYRSRSDTYTELQKRDEAYWDSANIKVGGVTLDGEEVMRAIDWGESYAKLIEMLSTDMEPETYDILIKVSTAIVPKKRLSRWRSMKNSVWRRIGDMRNLIISNLIADIISNILCVLVLYNVWTGHGMSLPALVLNAMYEWVMGAIFMIAGVAVRDLVQSYSSGLFSAIWTGITNLFALFGLPKLVVYFNEWFAVFTRQQGNALVSGAKFAANSVLSNLIISGLMGWWNGTGLFVGATALFSYWGLVPIAIGAVIVTAYQWNYGDVLELNLMPNIGPNLNAISITLLLLSSEHVCKIFSVLSKSLARSCNDRLRKFIQTLFFSSIVRAVADVALLLARWRYPGCCPWAGKTRCELQLDKIMQNQEIIRQEFEILKEENTKISQSAIDTVCEIAQTQLELVTLLETKGSGPEYDANVDALNKKITGLTDTYSANLKKYNEANQKLSSPEAGETHKPLTLHDRVKKELLEINNRIQATDKNNVTELDKLKQEQSKLLVFQRKEEYDEAVKNVKVVKASQAGRMSDADIANVLVANAKKNNSETALQEALDELKQQRSSQTSQNVANEVLQLHKPTLQVPTHQAPPEMIGDTMIDNFNKETHALYVQKSNLKLGETQRSNLDKLYLEKINKTTLMNINLDEFAKATSEWNSFIKSLG